MAPITISAVRKSYGKLEVVHGVDLTIANGEFVVILGPSGCGKSTLLRMIAGLEPISAGTIAIDGRIVNDLEPRERGCAMVFQNYALYPHFTVAENIGYALKVAGVPKAERQRRVLEVSRSVGLESYLDRKPGQLSGGQRQRVAMGRAMIREPKVFLFDEPLSNLDAKLRMQMRLEIRRLHQRLNATSVFVTHDQVEAMTLADRIVVMNAGRIEQVGTPTEIYAHPRSLFVAGFIGAPPMNLLHATLSGGAMARVGDHTIQLDGLVSGRADGAPLVVGIRPEDVAITPNAQHRMRVDVVEKLGSVQLVHGAFGGRDLVVQCPASQVVAQGDEIGLAFPADRLHLFEVDGGARIESATPVSTSTAASAVA
jgi:sn-glycerol 3-phosphate transport system ATP-binding protein